MKLIKYKKENLDAYLENLRIVSSLSKLFSNNDTPMIYYRATEFLYCKSFGAEDLSRTDMSVDARYEKVGIGIKTFLEGNKKTFQKVAEFNREQTLYQGLDVKEKVLKIVELRNERLRSTLKMFNLEKLIYHCIIRNQYGLNLYEEAMDLIDINNIEISYYNKATIQFTDGKHTYRFNNSKSTLYKQFIINDYFASVEIVILEDPMLMLNKNYVLTEFITSDYEYIILPLYSTKQGINFIAEKSGLNQWNASGRKRNPNEVYIPFPAVVKEKYRDFFPNRDEPFDVYLPNGEKISMKICQDGDKAIMSKPNKALGQWLLRDILGIAENILVTYDMLLQIGIDSVLFEKKEGLYYLNFKEIGTFEEFINNNLDE